MPRYLFEAAYTNDSWATQVKSRENVVERVRPLAEGLGGRVLDAYYAFGEYDVFVLLEFPTNEQRPRGRWPSARGARSRPARRSRS